MQSAEMPLLFKMQFSQTWTNVYEKYYGQKGGWMAGFVLFSFNVQLGAGRNSVSVALCNFNVIASWNARYGKAAKVLEMPQKGQQIQMLCFLCKKTATAVTPICEECAATVKDLKGASGTN